MKSWLAFLYWGSSVLDLKIFGKKLIWICFLTLKKFNYEIYKKLNHDSLRNLSFTKEVYWQEVYWKASWPSTNSLKSDNLNSKFQILRYIRNIVLQWDPKLWVLQTHPCRTMIRNLLFTDFSELYLLSATFPDMVITISHNKKHKSQIL